MKVELDLGYRDRVSYTGKHRDIAWEVACHGFKDKEMEELTRNSLPNPFWNSYILLTVEQQAAWKDKLEDLPWNCGQTYYREITERNIDGTM